jgi:crossover junction endodeoxyribonuclease RuvC
MSLPLPAMNNNLVLGLDPGIARFGWAIVTAGANPRFVTAGCFITPSTMPEGERLAELAAKLRELMIEQQPGRVVMEQLFFSSNVSTALTVGQARGVAMLAAAEARLPVIEFSPTQIKLAVTGNGRADKGQVEQMVMRLLGLEKKPRYDDTTDALALAWCGAQSILRT